MFNVWDGDKIPYWDLARQLFKKDGEQEMVPFLGAGVSVSDRKDAEVGFQPSYPAKDTLDAVASLLKVEGDARLYLEYAIRTATWMQAWEKANGKPLSRDQFQKRLADNEYPPFAWELSELLAQLAPYNSLERAAKAAVAKALVGKELLEAQREKIVPMVKLLAVATEIANITDPLSSISSYYEAKSERKNLWKHLFDVVSGKVKPTKTHSLIAAAAEMHLSAPVPEDYLIITTNYDSLMEAALDAKNLPYVVLWRNRSNGLIYTRFANLPKAELDKLKNRNEPRAPDHCQIMKGKAMVVVYKMHGCLNKDLSKDDDGLVITDSDYVSFISELGNIIPSHVGALLGAKQLLFLGYSFSDWNVRSLYESVIPRTAKKGGTPDYAVTRSLSEFEQTYFKNRDITVVLSDLASFSIGIQDQVQGI